MWSEPRSVSVGGLTCVGFGEADGRELLLVVSHDGRGVFELDLTRVARDRAPIDDSWHDDERHTAIGIGPLTGVAVPVAGLWGGALPARTSDGWEVELLGGERVVLRAPDGRERVVLEETVFAVRAVGFSPRGAALVVATTGDVTVFTREPARKRAGPERNETAGVQNGGMAEIEMTLGWVIAYVDDPAAAADFYERTFGLRKDFVVPGEYAQMDTGSTKLGFATYALARGNFDGGVRAAGSDGPPPNVEIALVAEDVDAAYRIAVDAGCEPLAAPTDKPQGQRVGYVRDPFGMLVELATPL